MGGMKSLDPEMYRGFTAFSILVFRLSVKFKIRTSSYPLPKSFFHNSESSGFSGSLTPCSG
jgi:hypothetical protein